MIRNELGRSRSFGPALKWLSIATQKGLPNLSVPQSMRRVSRKPIHLRIEKRSRSDLDRRCATAPRKKTAEESVAGGSGAAEIDDGLVVVVDGDANQNPHARCYRRKR
jgi:hypothetical protein